MTTEHMRGICGHCYGYDNPSNLILAWHGMTVHMDCEMVSIGHQIERTDAEFLRFMGAGPEDQE